MGPLEGRSCLFRRVGELCRVQYRYIDSEANSKPKSGGFVKAVKLRMAKGRSVYRVLLGMCERRKRKRKRKRGKDERRDVL